MRLYNLPSKTKTNHLKCICVEILTICLIIYKNKVTYYEKDF